MKWNKKQCWVYLMFCSSSSISHDVRLKMVFWSFQTQFFVFTYVLLLQGWNVNKEIPLCFYVLCPIFNFGLCWWVYCVLWSSDFYTSLGQILLCKQHEILLKQKGDVPKYPKKQSSSWKSRKKPRTTARKWPKKFWGDLSVFFWQHINFQSMYWSLNSKWWGQFLKQKMPCP